MATIRLPPGTRPPRLRGMKGTLIARPWRGGAMVVAKWPSPQPGPLNPVTDQQVATWDDAMQLIKLADGQQVIYAQSITKVGSFLGRDVLTAAAYGHMVSWPGWGVYPQGGAGPPVYLTNRGLPSFPPRPLGSPQPTNIAYQIKLSQSGSNLALTFNTGHPASPTVLRFCCPPIHVAVPTKRGSEMRPHGTKLFFPCDPAEYTGAGAGTTFHSFTLPGADFRPPCPHCQLVIVEKEVQPNLNWSSLPFDCIAARSPLPPGWYFHVVAFASGTHPFVPTPAQIASNDALWNAARACWATAGTVLDAQRFQHTVSGVNGIAFSTVPVPLACLLPGSRAQRTTHLVNPFFQSDGGSGDDYYQWWVWTHVT